MGNGPVVNTINVKSAMIRNGITIEHLASHLGRSVTLTRNIVNGYVPRKDGDEILKAIAEKLSLSRSEVVLKETRKKATA